MKSLKNYSNSNISHINSISATIENKPITESIELIKRHGANIDSVMEKLGKYVNRLSNENYITESDQNILFNIEEQYAVRDIFLAVAEQYERGLYIEFCNENNIEFDANLINEGLKDALGNIYDKIRDSGQKVKQAAVEVADKVKAVKEFVKEITQKAIKSAKDLFNTFSIMLIKFGEGLGKIFEKIAGDNAEDYKKAYFEQIKEKSEEKIDTKEYVSIFETLANKLNNNEEISDEYINEFLGFGKKKEQDKEEQDKEEKGGHYAAAGSAKAGKSVNGSTIGNVIWKAFLQMAVYYTFTLIIPCFIFFVSGGTLSGVAVIMHYVATILWAGVGIVKQCIHIYKLIKSGEFKKRKPFHKVITIIWWVAMFYFQGAAIAGAGAGLKEVFEFLKDGGSIANVLPPEALTNLLYKINEWYKNISGKDFDAIKHIETVFKSSAEELAKGLGADAEGASKAVDSMKNASETNNWTNIDAATDGNNALVDQLKEITKNDSIKSYRDVHNAFKELTGNTGNNTCLLLDRNTFGQGMDRGNWIDQAREFLAKELGCDVSDISVNQLTVDAAKEFSKGQGGTLCMFTVKGQAATPEIISKLTELHSGNGFLHILSEPFKAIAQSAPIASMIGQFIPFAGLMPIALKYAKKGGFKVRLGSGRTKSHIYLCDGDYVKSIPYSKFVKDSNFTSRNSKAITEMDKYVQNNINSAKALIKKIEDGKNISRDDKKKIKKLTKWLERCTEGKSEFEVLVFYTNDPLASMSKNESFDNMIDDTMLVEGTEILEPIEPKETDDKGGNKGGNKEMYPLFFFNPILLCGGDLAPRTKSKKPRAHIYLAKGLLSRLEFLPINGGLSGSEIIEMFSNIMKESLKASYDMAFDVPCIKQDGKFVENEHSEQKDKERMDFGGFTNKQITDFMNDPDKVADFLGGQFATDTISGGKHEFIEQTDTEKRVLRNKKVREEFKKLLTSDEIKDFMDKKAKTIKSVLFTKDGELNEEEFNNLLLCFMRVENTYLKGDKKLGFFKRMKNVFVDKKEIDPSELKALTLKIAAIRTKNESLEDGNYIILTANMEIFEKEFITYCNGEVINEEKTKSYANLVIE